MTVTITAPVSSLEASLILVAWSGKEIPRGSHLNLHKSLRLRRYK
jgi:hypothetical protein